MANAAMEYYPGDWLWRRYGFAAGAFKLLAPWSVAPAGPAMAKELLGAALAFALLCAGAAALRNFIVRRLLGSGIERR
jgi:hypothetical protein